MSTNSRNSLSNINKTSTTNINKTFNLSQSASTTATSEKFDERLSWSRNLPLTIQSNDVETSTMNNSTINLNESREFIDEKSNLIDSYDNNNNNTSEINKKILQQNTNEKEKERDKKNNSNKDDNDDDDK